jgi:hypothetical protein
VLGHQILDFETLACDQKAMLQLGQICQAESTPPLKLVEQAGRGAIPDRSERLLASDNEDIGADCIQFLKPSRASQP